MMLDAGKGAHTFVQVQVTFTQDGDRIEGHWRALDGPDDAGGLVSGTVAGEVGRQAVNVRFTYAGPHPISSIPAAKCSGAASSEGQLTYNTTIDTAGRQAHERPGWSIRLKAVEGFRFESCPAIGYATWTLTRQQ